MQAFENLSSCCLPAAFCCLPRRFTDATVGSSRRSVRGPKELGSCHPSAKIDFHLDQGHQFCFSWPTTTTIAGSERRITSRISQLLLACKNHDMMSNPAGTRVCPISILHEEPGFLVVLRLRGNEKREVPWDPEFLETTPSDGNENNPIESSLFGGWWTRISSEKTASGGSS